MSASPELPLRAEHLLAWLATSGLRIVLILATASLLLRLIRLFTERLSRPLSELGPQTLEQQKRTQTLSATARTVATTVLFAITTMLVLEEIGVDVVPFVAAAGIGGLAIGFGAQNLVRDVIAGFFLLLEDQIRVGDVVKIGDKSGQVELIGLRIITLRDFDGSVHIIPNGTITSVTNQTKEFSYAVVTLGVSYRADIDAVIALLKTIGEELPHDPTLSVHLLGELEVLGLDDFSAPRLKITLRVKTVPAKQWAVARELRRRIKLAFDVHHIKLI
jgi:small conductance mechanosensitive channel